MRHLYLVVMWLFALHSYAQKTTEIKPFRVGVFGGSNILGKTFTTEKLHWATGFSAGIDAGHYFGGLASGASLHFKPNFAYFRQTWKRGSLDGNFYIERKWRWSALNFPVLFRYSFGLGHFRPFVEAGLNFRIRTALSYKAREKACYGQGMGCVMAPTLTVELQEEVKNDLFGAVWVSGLKSTPAKPSFRFLFK